MAKAIITFKDTKNGTALDLRFVPNVNLDNDKDLTNAQAMGAGTFSALVKKMKLAERNKET